MKSSLNNESYVDYLNRNFGRKINRVYFIGIGGVGISSLARIFLNLNYIVSGSDISVEESDYLFELKEKINIYLTHSDKNIRDFKPDLIIYTEAISKESNLEYIYAKNNNILLETRSRILKLILFKYKKIGILGTHGKTTVSTLFSNMAYEAGYDPLILLGGKAPFINSNLFIGKGNLAIFEACEAYGALFNYDVDIAFINNIDLDHIDYFHNLENLKKEFFSFIYRNFHNENNKILLANYDDKNIIEIIGRFGLKVKNLNLISISSNLDLDNVFLKYPFKNIFHVKNIIFKSNYTKYDFFINGRYIRTIISNIKGKTSIYNSLAALSLSFLTYIPINIPLYVLKNFKNARRRFEKLYSFYNHYLDLSIDIYHDYAHHPIEIEVFFEKLEQLKKYHFNILIFQPHLTSRFLYFKADFLKQFIKSEEIILLPSFQARKNNEHNKNQELNFVEIIHQFKIIYPHQKISYLKDFTIKDYQLLISKYQKTSISISFLGAGNINQIAENVVRKLIKNCM